MGFTTLITRYLFVFLLRASNANVSVAERGGRRGSETRESPKTLGEFKL